MRARRQGALEEMLQRVRAAPLRAQCAVAAWRLPLEYACFPVSVQPLAFRGMVIEGGLSGCMDFDCHVEQLTCAFVVTYQRLRG